MARQLETTDRPWLSVSVWLGDAGDQLPVSPFARWPEGPTVRLAVGYQVKNVGKSVANRVAVNIGMVYLEDFKIFRDWPQELVKRQKETCAEQRRIALSEGPLFPNEEFRRTQYLTNIPPPVPRFIPQSRGGQLPEQVSVMVFGCVDYYAGSGNDILHETDFMYDAAPYPDAYDVEGLLNAPLNHWQFHRFEWGNSAR
jgi:hypothetical protein